MRRYTVLRQLRSRTSGLPRNRFLNRLTFATMITAPKTAFRNSCGSSIIGWPLSRARSQSEEGEGEDRTAGAVQFENMLDHLSLLSQRRWVWVTAEHGDKALIREPVQSDEPASAQEFAFSGDVPGFRII
jgi:hypothetical protein